MVRTERERKRGIRSFSSFRRAFSFFHSLRVAETFTIVDRLSRPSSFLQRRETLSSTRCLSSSSATSSPVATTFYRATFLTLSRSCFPCFFVAVAVVIVAAAFCRRRRFPRLVLLFYLRPRFTSASCSRVSPLAPG